MAQNDPAYETEPGNINTPPPGAVTIFKNINDGLYYGKKSDGSIELIGGPGSGSGITGGEASFPGGGATTISKADANALTTSLIVITEHGAGTPTDAYSYNVAVNGTIDFYASGGLNPVTISYLVFNP